MYFGIPRWQHTFAEKGLDLVTKQWLRWLSPDRLAASLSVPAREREKKVRSTSARG